MAKSLILVAFTIIVVAEVTTAAPDSNKRHILRNQPSYIPISFGRRDTKGVKDSSSLYSSLNFQREIEPRSQNFPITFGKRDDKFKRIPGLFPSKRNSKSEQTLPITFGKRDDHSASYPVISFRRKDIQSVSSDKRDSQSYDYPSISYGRRDSLHKQTSRAIQDIVPRNTRLSRQLYNYGPDMYMVPEEMNYLTGMEEPMDFDYGLYFPQNTPGNNIFGKYTLPIWNLDSTGFMESDEIPMAMLKRNEERLAKDRSTRYDQKKKKKLFLGLPRFGDQDRSAESTLKGKIRSIKNNRDTNQPPPVIYEG